MSGSFLIVDVPLAAGGTAKGLVEGSRQTLQSPIIIDFQSPKLRHRLKNGADSEAIVKAIGLKRSERAGKLIYDFTAGLGTEAFLLAQAGFRVVAFERDPMVFALLDDGLSRLRAAIGEKINLNFVHTEATQYFNERREKAHAITLDPMFEGDATSGKSLPKKEMASLRKLLIPSTDEEMRSLFYTAHSNAEARVIVKRPSGAPDLVSTDETGRRLVPVHRLEGKTARFDIYSCR
jgi:16S rRNA (guanine1516-N2)-methyltransferase